MTQPTTKVPVGFRFHPTDEELVGYYLPKKVTARKIDLDLIRDLDLYKLEPWDLQGQYKLIAVFFFVFVFLKQFTRWKISIDSEVRTEYRIWSKTPQPDIEFDSVHPHLNIRWSLSWNRALQDPGRFKWEANRLLLLQSQGQEVSNWQPSQPCYHEGLLEGNRAG